MNLEFKKELPYKEGQYLIKWKEPIREHKPYELITLVFVPPCFAYGYDHDSYMAISEWGMKSVNHLNLMMVEGIAELINA